MSQQHITISNTTAHRHTNLLLRLLIQLTLISPITSFGSFKLPQWPFPTITKDNTQRTTTTLSPTDPILIIGGTGGVGQLTARKLLSRGFQNIRITTRDPIRAASLFDDDDDDDDDDDFQGLNNKPTFIEWDLVSPIVTDDDIISNIISDAAAIIITTGTTAFPSQRWRGGNTPQAIDQYATERLMTALNNNGNNNNVKKCLLVTSIGIERRSQMPFAFLNLFGVLDAKRKGEEAVIAAAEAAGLGYVVIRPGRLVGGPYTNADIAGLLKIEGGAENGVTLERGDTQLGDCKRDACAEAVVQSLLNPNCNNVVYSMITTEGKALSDEEWNDAFVGLG